MASYIPGIEQSLHNGPLLIEKIQYQVKSIHKNSRSVHKYSRSVHKYSRSVGRYTNTVGRSVHKYLRSVHEYSRPLHKYRLLHKYSRSVHDYSRSLHKCRSLHKYSTRRSLHNAVGRYKKYSTRYQIARYTNTVGHYTNRPIYKYYTLVLHKSALSTTVTIGSFTKEAVTQQTAVTQHQNVNSLRPNAYE